MSALQTKSTERLLAKEPEGEPELDIPEIVLHPKQSRQNEECPTYDKCKANLPNLIRKTGTCMMLLSAIVFNAMVINALVKSQQASTVASLPSTKGGSNRALDAPVTPVVSTKGKLDLVTNAPQSGPELQREDHTKMMVADPSVHFIMPVPLPPEIPLPSTRQDSSGPHTATLGESMIAVSRPTLKTSAPQTFKDGLSVKMFDSTSGEDDDIVAKTAQPPETEEEREERARKKLHDLLSEAQDHLGARKAGTTRLTKGSILVHSKGSVSSGRLHSQEDSSDGGGVIAKWGNDMKQDILGFR